MAGIDWADVKVGDPDPTDAHLVGVAADDYFCDVPDRSGALCSRQDGHSGRHVAGDGDTVLAVWP